LQCKVAKSKRNARNKNSVLHAGDTSMIERMSTAN